MNNEQKQTTLSKKIAALLVERGESASSLAIRSGLQPSTLLRILTGEVKKPRNATVAQLALFLGVQPKELIGKDVPIGAPSQKHSRLNSVPLLRSPLRYWDDDIYEEASANPDTVWVPLPAGLKPNAGELCALRVNGDALAPRIRHGDIVFLEYKVNPEYKNDSYVLAFVGTPVEAPVNGDYVLRRLFIVDGKYYLRCDNPELPKELVRGDPVATVVGLSTTRLP